MYIHTRNFSKYIQGDPPLTDKSKSKNTNISLSQEKQFHSKVREDILYEMLYSKMQNFQKIAITSQTPKCQL